MESPLTTTIIKKPCFIGEDNGLASIPLFSTNNISYPNNNNNINRNNNNYNNNNNNGYFVDNENHMMRRRNSLRNISSLSNNNDVSSSGSISTNITTIAFSPRSRFDDVVYSPHYLESCALCRKPLGGNRDIFMYRGDTPFCSEECRQEQIEMDEAKEKNWKLKSLRTKKDANKKTSTSTTKPQNYSYRTSTIAAA